ncbi:MAG TPA: Wzz/FepE/Etk N-terminal domain-containing protein [Mycobacteriales bacterium]|nr:Wzz/FepE/Etk N-terminal domain-containing protein [Mycobacteriales bacterium]
MTLPMLKDRVRRPAPTTGGGLPSTPPPEDRLSMLWSAKFWVIALVVVAAAATYLISSQLPATYQSQSTVVVTSRGSSTISPLDTVNASDGLASQYAQVVSTKAITGPASSALGRASLAGNVTASTVANQNLIHVQVREASPTEAQRETRAVAAALVKYIGGSANSQQRSYGRLLSHRLAGLDTAINHARKAVRSAKASTSHTANANSAGATTLNNAQLNLSALIQRKQYILSQAGVDETSQQPSAAIVAPASAASKAYPKPLLFAGIAALVALLVGIELAWVAGRRRTAQWRTVALS